MEPLINWQELMNLNRPPRPSVRPENGINMWDNEANLYNKMSALEKELTLNQVNALPLSPDDTVIDLGCGCGRLSVPISERVKSVTAMDSSRVMLDNCINNAKAAGRDNVEPLFLDFFEAEAGKNVPVHDIAFCSRSAALGNPAKLSSFARKYAAALIFANAPSIPELLGKLFEGTFEVTQRRPPRPRYDRRVAYNATWNIVYDLGYEPNVTIVDDGFKAEYSSVEEACNDLRMLAKEPITNEQRYAENVESFMKKLDNGKYEFLMPTRTAVIWWEINPKKFF